MWDYIRAGADVVTANTFASARHLLERAGIGERTAELQRLAVTLAREAAARTSDEVGRTVAVAGPLSTMRPVGKGTDQRDPMVDLTTIPWAANLREAAELQAEAGADLLLLEMISDLEHGGLALEAALATGLPMWIGLSAKWRDGRLMSFREDGPAFADLVRHFAAQPIGALGVMHTSLPDTEAALPILLEHTRMPVMAYPEAGYFRSPDWEFAAIEPAALGQAAKDWVSRGVRVVGGCAASGRRTSRPWRGPSRALTPRRPTREVADAAATARHVTATSSRESCDAPFCKGRRDGPGHVPARVCPRHPGADLHAGRPCRQRLRPRGLLHRRQAGRGQSDLTYAWNGATWRFASQGHLDQFKADPAKYAPQFGGYCAWAVSQGYTASADPQAWKVVDGKLYLNYNLDVQKTWVQDVSGNIAKGEGNWPAVLDK